MDYKYKLQLTKVQLIVEAEPPSITVPTGGIKLKAAISAEKVTICM